MKCRVKHDEVSLVDAVKTCNDCQWFWGGVAPYGPFPAFDWQEKYPQAIKDGPPSSDEDVVYWTDATQVKGNRVEPAVLRGCRKAPIMTIGINPNMTAFFAGANASTWAYPYFSNDETYAYYYRHAKIHQESFALDELQQQIIPETEIRAEHDCSVMIERSNTHRWLSVIFENHIDGKVDKEHREYSWLPEERLVIFAQNNKDAEAYLVEFSDSAQQSFRLEDKLNNTLSLEESSEKYDGLRIDGLRKGDLIAGKIQAKSQDEFKVFANKVGYYDRATPIIDAFNAFLHGEGFNNAKLEIGEDLSMHDMVACASPGWSKERYGIPTEALAHKCVDQNQYMFDQLVQSKPKVIFIVSKSSLNMFAPAFVESFGGSFDFDYKKKDAFTLLKETCEKPVYLSWGENEQFFQSRVIVTPHFSYADNFEEQCRFATEAAWSAFKTLFESDIQVLERFERIDESKDGKTATIFVKKNNDPMENKLSKACWELLMHNHMQPYDLIHQALQDEHNNNPLITDTEARHLDRAPGNCSYCVNTRWRFPEGCEYGLA